MSRLLSSFSIGVSIRAAVVVAQVSFFHFSYQEV